MFAAHHLVTLTELVHDEGRVVLWYECLKEAVGARQDVVDAGPARVNKKRSRHAVARGHAAEIEGLLDVIGIALPGREARCLLGSVRQQPSHLLCIEACCAAG